MSSSRRVILLGSVLLALVATGLGHFPLVVRAGLTWSGPVQVDTYTLINNSNYSPSALQAKDGSLWLAWESDRLANLTAGIDTYDILYKVRSTGGVWNSWVNITGSGDNHTPSLTQLSNGTIMIFWSSNPTGISCSPVCNLYYERFLPTQRWSPRTPLFTGTFNDSSPTTTIAPDGTLWIFWTRTICIGTPCNRTSQIYYSTLKGNMWSAAALLTNDSNWYFNPSAMFGKDGVLRVTYAKGAPSQTYFQIYLRTYGAGVWGVERQIITSTNADTAPSLAQDRNGTLWTFYIEAVPLSALVDQFALFSSFSIDNGASWSSPVRMTHDSTAPQIDDKLPFVVQTADKTVWVFYASDLTMNGKQWDIYALDSSQVSPVHDVVASSLLSSASWLYAGGSKILGQSANVTFTVTVVNLGDFAESVTVQLSATNFTTYNLGSRVLSAPLGGSAVFTFGWNTTGITPGIYSLKATATIPIEPLGNQGDDIIQANRLVWIVAPGGAAATAGGGGRVYHT